MIRATQTAVPEARLNDIHAWMHRQEAAELIHAVKCEIAALLAEAGMSAIDSPHWVMSENVKLAATAEYKLKEAARLKIFLDVFEEKRVGEDSLITTTLTIV